MKMTLVYATYYDKFISLLPLLTNVFGTEIVV